MEWNLNVSNEINTKLKICVNYYFLLGLRAVDARGTKGLIYTSSLYGRKHKIRRWVVKAATKTANTKKISIRLCFSARVHFVS